MTAFFESDWVTIWQADARTAAGLLEPDSVDAIVTSPPYFGLRDYGVDGQIGLEPSPDEYVSDLADLLTSYVGPLKAGGSLWLNLGDTYAANRTYQVGQTKYGNDAQERGTPMLVPDGWRAKCLLMIPERVALALIARGWILRNRVVWAKPNGMPTSAKDRLATKHEALFHFVRAQRYYYDLDAIREPHAPHPRNNKSKVRKGDTKYTAIRGDGWSGDAEPHPNGANPGDVWEIPTQPYPAAHFAVFPPELVRRPILATVPERVCRGCGTPRERITERPTYSDPGRSEDAKYQQDAPKSRSHDSHRRLGAEYQKWLNENPKQTVGWSDCGCGAGWTPGTVLDPFLGSGTTADMARRLGRKAVGIELNDDYCRLAADRFAQAALPFGYDT